MQILKESPECYIQMCENCGAVLKYSEHDIIPANTPWTTDTGWGVSMRDCFECPSCGCHNSAERRWLME